VGEFDPSVWFRLVERDRRLLVLLSKHRVLTTEQIAAVEFTLVRRAQDRLRILRELGMLFAFRDSFAGGGTSPNRYTLGYAGARLIAAQREQAPPTPATHQLTQERLAASPRLGHLLGVNQFFCDLIAYARHIQSDPSATFGTNPTKPTVLPRRPMALR
jgi:Replication-relaxation